MTYVHSACTGRTPPGALFLSWTRRFCVGITSVLRRGAAVGGITLYFGFAATVAQAVGSYRTYDTVLDGVWDVCRPVLEEGALDTDGLDLLTADQVLDLREALDLTPEYIEEFFASEVFYAFWAGGRPVVVLGDVGGTDCHVVHVSTNLAPGFTDDLLADWRRLTQPETGSFKPSRAPELRTVYELPFSNALEGELITPLSTDFASIAVNYRYGEVRDDGVLFELVFFHAKVMRRPASQRYCSLWPEACPS